MVNLLQQPEPTKLCTVKVGRRDIIVKQGTCTSLRCRVHAGAPKSTSVLLEADVERQWSDGLEINDAVVTIPKGNSCWINILISNPSGHDITIAGKTCLGTLHAIRSIIPGEAKSVPQKTSETSASVSNLNSDIYWDPPINLDHLSEEQQAIAARMLREESKVFARDEQDMGNIEKLQMGIKLNDATPVQRTYQSIPRPLYREVKDYITDLLNRGCRVREKKYGSLRLCVDYRQLNLKTITDRQPIPRIQDMLDSLGATYGFLPLTKARHTIRSS